MRTSDRVSRRFSFLGSGPLYEAAIPAGLHGPFTSTLLDFGNGSRDVAYYPAAFAPPMPESHWILKDVRESNGRSVQIYERPKGDVLQWLVVWHTDGGIVLTHVRGEEGFAQVDSVVRGVSILPQSGESPIIDRGPGVSRGVGRASRARDRVLYQLQGTALVDHMQERGALPHNVEFIRPGTSAAGVQRVADLGEARLASVRRSTEFSVDVEVIGPGDEGVELARGVVDSLRVL
ncbi:MAG: hypothetical protein GY788_23620 [bacterium]|nr:hypothetical protein [bacterium]